MATESFLTLPCETLLKMKLDPERGRDISKVTQPGNGVEFEFRTAISQTGLLAWRGHPHHPYFYPSPICLLRVIVKGIFLSVKAWISKNRTLYLSKWLRRNLTQQTAGSRENPHMILTVISRRSHCWLSCVSPQSFLLAIWTKTLLWDLSFLKMTQGYVLLNCSRYSSPIFLSSNWLWNLTWWPVLDNKIGWEDSWRDSGQVSLL